MASGRNGACVRKCTSILLTGGFADWVWMAGCRIILPFQGGAQGVACGFVNSASSGSQSKAPGFAWGYLLLYQRNSRPADIVGAFVEHAESCLNESLAHVLQIFGGLHAVSVEFHGAVIVTAAYQRAHAFKVLHSGKVHNVICCIQKAGCERQDG